ncbi:MAG: hypothetical protein H6Q30_127 [Bacteroidetes bacterium]|jgi:hypothetical protein|nr:hypothetical protein [Bacteroidota bacterium]
MKAVAMVAAAMVLFSASATQAQDKEYNNYFSDPAVYQRADLSRALKAFESCLATDNAGVQESAMAHLAMLKLVIPAVDAAKISSQLEELSTSAAAPGTRYKAYIASQVYKNPELFAGERGMSYGSGDELFNALAARLQTSLLSYSGK